MNNIHVFTYAVWCIAFNLRFQNRSTANRTTLRREAWNLKWETAASFRVGVLDYLSFISLLQLWCPLYSHWILIINCAPLPHLSPAVSPSSVASSPLSPPPLHISSITPSHPACLKTNQSKSPERASLGKPGRLDEQPFIKKITKLKLHFSI